ncbi:hypothetical protein Tco_0227775 [Tanacetum coccineum]
MVNFAKLKTLTVSIRCSSLLISILITNMKQHTQINLLQLLRRHLRINVNQTTFDYEEVTILGGRKKVWTQGTTKSKLSQVVAITVLLLSVVFYAFSSPFLGKDIYKHVAIGVYSFLVLCVFILYIRCITIDPVDLNILIEPGRASPYRLHNGTEVLVEF